MDSEDFQDEFRSVNRLSDFEAQVLAIAGQAEQLITDVKEASRLWSQGLISTKVLEDIWFFFLNEPSKVAFPPYDEGELTESSARASEEVACNWNRTRHQIKLCVMPLYTAPDGGADDSQMYRRLLIKRHIVGRRPDAESEILELFGLDI